MTNVAILGGCGHIARGLTVHLPADWNLQLFASKPEGFAEAAARHAEVRPYQSFAAGNYDLIINAAGPGDPGSHRAIGADLFRITERFDNMVLDYLAQHPDAGYVYMSTGAIYGPDYAEAGSSDPIYPVHVNRLGDANHYVLAKVAAEAKHRLAGALRIADLRIFGYFSRYIDLNAQFFAALAVSHLCRGQVFHTHPADFVRDYISPEDLAALVVWVFGQGVPNGVFDAISARPVTKFDLLDALKQRFGLRYAVDGGAVPQRQKVPVTLDNKVYTNQYYPRAASLDTVVREVEELLRSEPRLGRVGA